MTPGGSSSLLLKNSGKKKDFVVPHSSLWNHRHHKAMNIRYGHFIIGALFFCLISLQTVSSSSFFVDIPQGDQLPGRNEYAANLVHRDPEFVYNMLSKLRKSILKPLVKIRTAALNTPGPSTESTKRGLDFGLGRGFSGTQAAKHFMGLAAAKYAGGPGKRKRNPFEDMELHY
ncbi:diuretic hormone class 2 isoform X1 [Lepeophtheirus salmonis]|uniref:diuretic hormone class 2 isoform X1 n=1 Tax=Lepeophtheirus salmonis TaxID=72036 RepID=UPI00077F5E25|nr:diuretic hormone class 2-like isoform X1 [Lepeophtheirus salmonis]